MSLLTPSESHAFQNFLSQMDHPDQVSSEWSVYQDYHDSMHVPPPQMQGTEALAKATKDLMSLDADRWNIQQQNQQPNYDYYPHQYGRYETQFTRPHQPRRNVTFPFLAKQTQQPHLQIPTVHHHPPDPMSSSSSHSFTSMSTPTTASSSSSFSFGQQMLPSPTSPVSAGAKRPLESATMSISKRSRPSPPLYSRPQPPSPTPTLTSAKPALLSPSQKKANHIQSEQKRRANIRRGYEALCETVPALREAIRQEEETLASGGSKDLKGKSKKSKTRGKMDEATGEKTDGRAGPRSENVVLMKTIDYIHDLQFERSELLQRLETARAALPPGHPVLFPSTPQPLWEREWKGGEDKEEAEASEEVEEDGE